MRILVIGGTTFIGRRVVDLLVERGDDVLVVHRGRTEPEPVLGRHLHVDRSEFATRTDEVGAFAPDGVVDTGANSAADVEAVLPHLPEVPIVVLSSGDVYRAFEILIARGPAEVPVPFDENGPLRANRYPYRSGAEPGHWMYDYDKLDVEPAYLARGATVLRLGMVFGARDPQRREEFVLRRVRAGRTRIPVGTAGLLLPLVDIDDTARAVLAALDQPDRASGEVFNIAAPSVPSVGGWMRAILAAAGHEAELTRVSEDLLPNDLRLTRGSEQNALMASDKAIHVLGWRPTDLGDAITASVRWHLDNPPPDPDTDFSPDDEALKPS
jgi:nucleoside-diphosphate-sugar epimerase